MSCGEAMTKLCTKCRNGRQKEDLGAVVFYFDFEGLEVNQRKKIASQENKLRLEILRNMKRHEETAILLARP